MCDNLEMCVPIGGGRHDLRSLLASDLASRVSSSRSNCWLDEMDDEEYLALMRQWGYCDDLPFDFEDDGELLYPSVEKSKGKKRKVNDKRAKVIDFYAQDDTECIYGDSDGKKSKGKKNGCKKRYKDDIDSSMARTSRLLDDDMDDSDMKAIYFYTDYNDKSSVCCFASLNEFDTFCADNGFKVDDYVAEDLVYSSESHCCLNPISREYGEFEIMRSDSYEDLTYEIGEYAFYSSF